VRQRVKVNERVGSQSMWGSPSGLLTTPGCRLIPV
jgi:hypothetical protein